MRIMTSGLVLALLFATPALAKPSDAPSVSAEAQEAQRKFEALPWVNGGAPAITDRATITLNDRVRYLNAAGTSSLLQLTGNLPESDSFTVAPKDAGWFAVYSFSDIGYVKDDETIDADALLQTMRDNQKLVNDERAEQGLEPLTIAGWAVPPHYDPQTKNLEYGVTLTAPSGTNINYHMRMLGRRGVMDAALVTSQDYLKADLAAFRQANAGFAFKPAESYAAFQQGDKVSEYGLAALITGGAAAAAAKTGVFKGLLLLLAKFFKPLLIGLAVLGAGVMRLFGRKGDADAA